MSTTTVAPKIQKGRGLTMSRHYDIRFLYGTLANNSPNRVMEWNAHNYPIYEDNRELAVKAFKNIMNKPYFKNVKIIVLSAHEVDTDT